MKLKSVLGAVLAGALALGSTLAYAQAGPIYLTPKLLYSRQMTGSFNGTVNSGIFNTNYNGSDATDSVFGGGLAIGYDFGAVGYTPIRAELEFLARGESETNYSGKLGGYTSLGTPIYSSYSVTNKIYTLFANIYYDFVNDTDFTPYIGGGIGGAYVDTTYSGLHANSSLRDGFVEGNGNTNDWNFAWNLGGGVSYDFSDSLALDVGYRYVDLGSAEPGSVSTATYSGSPKLDYTSHEISVGLRFSGF